MFSRQSRGAMASLFLASLLATQAPIEAKGKTFHLSFHPQQLSAELAQKLADAALAAAESVRPQLEKWQLKPAKPQRIHLYADPEAFTAAHAKFSTEPFVLDAFCRTAPAEAHVKLAFADQAMLTAIGLPPSTAQALMLSAVRLLAFEAAPIASKDPWRAGVVAYAAFETLTGAKAAGDPGYDGRRALLALQVKNLEGDDKPPKLAEWLAMFAPPGRIEDLAPDAGRMAIVGQLFASTGDGWVKKWLAEPPKNTARDAARRLAAESLVGKDWAKTEERWLKELKALKPAWRIEQPGVARAGDRWLMLGEGKEAAALTSVAAPPPGHYAIKLRIELLPGFETGTSVFIDRNDKSRLVLALQKGVLLLNEYKGEEVQQKGRARAAMAVGKPFEIAIEVRDQLRVLVDGEERLTAEIGTRDMRGEVTVVKFNGPLWIAGLRLESLAGK
jgi:hypothetical protein